MDYYYSTSSQNTTPIKQIDAFTTPVKKLRTPLVRTTSSPAFSYGTPEYFTPMSRRDSTSSFASSLDSWPMTPVSEEFIAPDMLYRSASQMGGCGGARPRSSTAGSMSSSCHPYYPAPSSAARMQRRHTHIGGSEEVPKIHWPAMPAYSSYDMYDEQQLQHLHHHQAALPRTPSQSAAYSAIQSATATPMRHQLSSPLAEMCGQQMNRLNMPRDVLPLIVSSMDKAHVCPHCNKRFKRLEHVKRHERSHTQVKPFACSIDGCGRYFSRSDNLKAHEKTHYKKGRNYRMMQKKLGSQEHLETAAGSLEVDPSSLEIATEGGEVMVPSSSDEGLGGSDEFDHHAAGIESQPPSPARFMAFGNDNNDEQPDMEEYEAFEVYAQ